MFPEQMFVNLFFTQAEINKLFQFPNSKFFLIFFESASISWPIFHCFMIAYFWFFCYQFQNYKPQPACQQAGKSQPPNYNLPFSKETAGGADAQKVVLKPWVIGIHIEPVRAEKPAGIDETGAQFSSR